MHFGLGKSNWMGVEFFNTKAKSLATLSFNIFLLIRGIFSGFYIRLNFRARFVDKFIIFKKICSVKVHAKKIYMR